MAVVRLPVLDARAAAPAPSGAGLLARLLEEQQQLTAVERFAQRHEDASAPLLESIYRERLPAAPPGPGQQYAFEVDLDRCSGCKACVTACHSLNGLDDGEMWRKVGILQGGTVEAPVLKTVTGACHHCVDPACMRGCPVKAYEKDPVTGIVKHLDDQCIGCQYCMLTCPYEVPQYNAARGIVRKCDMCAGRLAVGEAPACVQACPSSAITIRVVDVARMVEDAQVDAFLPGAPSPSITVPTTVYKTAEVLPRNTVPADFFAVRPAQQHMPLVIMLVLTQLSVGTLVVERLLSLLAPAAVATLRPLAATLALAVGLMALGASTLHLGRPKFAFRALLGLRTSWISREILAFGVFAGAAAAYAAATALLSPRPVWSARVGDVAAGLGVVGVGSSVMLYAVTQRAWWSFPRTAWRFLCTSAVLGLAVVHLAAVLRGDAPALVLAADVRRVLAVVVVVQIVAELSVLVHLRDKRHGDLKRTALLLVSHLRFSLGARVVLALAGGLLAPAGGGSVGAVVALVMLVGAELIERRLFFAAASAPRMPGVFS
jgi:Fe-S-cluster-containing dehydrogenase component/DMSO reductase anchor subunit